MVFVEFPHNLRNILSMEDLKNKDDFLKALRALDARFEEMEPELSVTLTDPEMGVEGYIVVWNTQISANGPLARMGKGGTRVTPSTTLDEVKMLARIMALKNAAAGLPLGGAKSGLKADSSTQDAEQKYKRFVELSKPYLHENGGVFGGFGYDIGARPEMAKWAVETLGSGRSFTGKPIDMGGTDYDVEGIAGLGVAVAAKSTLEHKKRTVAGSTFAVQGVGAMGAAVIRYFTEMGGTLKAVSDPRLGGSWFFTDGPPAGLVEMLGAGRIAPACALLESTNGHVTQPDSNAVLYAETDVLFPCAVQEVITAENADRILAAVVCEGANNPVTDTARTLLDERDICVIPDFIANPGGVIAAFVELTSDIPDADNFKTRAKVEAAKDMTRKRIAQNVKSVLNLSSLYSVRPTDAARFIALSNIFNLS